MAEPVPGFNYPGFESAVLPGGVGVMLNGSGVYTDDVIKAVMRNDVVMGQVLQFSQRVNEATVHRVGTFADRDRYIKPDTVFDQIRTARMALHDDIVSGAAEGTESAAFTDITISVNDAKQESVWKQIARDMRIDKFMRIAWSLLYSDSQFVAATYWHKKTYKTDGVNDKGNRFRGPVTLEVPEAVTFFDTLKVTPVGNLQWGEQRLAYIASQEEANVIEQALGTAEPVRPGVAAPVFVSTLVDESLDVIRKLILRRYTPTVEEARELMADGVRDVRNLFEMNPDIVWRHTLTTPPFQRFARVRMTSVFELLDLKTLLHQMDRAHLIGGANFIVLVTKGTDKLPADQREIDNLRAASQHFGQTPVVVGDHRLHVEIITANVDVTLNKDRYDVLDQRIAARLYQAIMPTQSEADPMKMARHVAAGLESRRKMLRLEFEDRVVDQIRRRNESFFKDRAEVVFSPATIQITFDPAWVNAMLDLGAENQMSLRTLLAQFGIDFDREMELRVRESGGTERLIRELEAAGTKVDGVLAAVDVFRGPVVAPVAGGPVAPVAKPGGGTAAKRGGRREGGNRNGGGAAPGTNQGGTNQNEPENPRRVKRTGTNRPEGTK